MSISQLFSLCRETGIASGEPDAKTLAPAVCMNVESRHWRTVAAHAKELGFRWSAFWASESADDMLEGRACLAHEGSYLIVRTLLSAGERLPSQANVYPAADRPERHARDLLGLEFDDAPDTRRWTRHQAWGGNDFPLREAHVTQHDGSRTAPDDKYPFVSAKGPGIVEIPVGPVHAGIIEPGHFRFQSVGETVLNLEQHLGYVHKGIEKLAVGKDPTALIRLASRVSGDSTVAHSWAASQALERALDVEIPVRAARLRAVMCERERVANHMGDIGAICNDVGFAFPQVQLSRMKELLLRENLRVFGHRFMMDKLIPGGIAADPDDEQLKQMAFQARNLAIEFNHVIERIEASESLEDRLMTTGRLTPDQAAMLGCTGFVGKASGQSFDVRRDAPYAPYDAFRPDVTVYRAGDVAARARVRADEAADSLRQIAELLESLPSGSIREPLPSSGDAEGIGFVEGWRGEIVSYVRLEAGKVARFFPRDPSWLTWPALELMMQGNLVPDFPVCNKSVNGSYSGQDL